MNIRVGEVVENAVTQLCIGSCRIIMVSGMDIHEGFACLDIEEKPVREWRKGLDSLIHACAAQLKGGCACSSLIQCLTCPVQVRVAQSSLNLHHWHK